MKKFPTFPSRKVQIDETVDSEIVRANDRFRFAVPSAPSHDCCEDVCVAAIRGRQPHVAAIQRFSGGRNPIPFRNGFGGSLLHLEPIALRKRIARLISAAAWLMGLTVLVKYVE